MNELHDTDGGNGDQKNAGQKTAGQRNVATEKMHQDSTARFLHSLSDSLDQSVDALDVSTQARLRAARRKALATGETQHRPAWLMPVASLAAAATVAALTVSVWLVPVDMAEDSELTPLEDIALLSDSEALEFYENLDFYLWLDEENKAG